MCVSFRQPCSNERNIQRNCMSHAVSKSQLDSLVKLKLKSDNYFLLTLGIKCNTTNTKYGDMNRCVLASYFIYRSFNQRPNSRFK